MCGIIGYAGNKEAAPVLIEGLAKLEYRGYDSAGIAVLSKEKINVRKSKGRLMVLSELTNGGGAVKGKIGIGHTRWATHGEPTDINSHPHLSVSGEFAVVHNGIIENYIPLKNKLISNGVKFISETDTEVVAHLFEYYYNGDVVETLIRVIKNLEGSYALCILSLHNPDEFVAVRKASPLIVGLGSEENFVASDVTAVLNYTKNIYYLDDNEIAVIRKDCVKVYNLEKEEIKKEQFVVEWDLKSAEKGGYEHFMIKEIEEQPKAIAATINPRVQNGEIVLDFLSLTEDYIKKINKIHIIACGSAYHAGVVGKYVIESLCKLPVEVSIASEFRYSDPIISKNDLAIIISQSGETADTLAALEEAKKKGARTIGIVNVVGSAIANAADDVLYTWAGPEISVASTKAYSTQLSVIYLLSVYLAKKLGRLTDIEYSDYVSEIKKLPEYVGEALKCKEQVRYLASKFCKCKSVFFIGRNLDYALSLEGSLKLKEISYIHSEAYAAGELKHGTISLVEDGTLVIALVTFSDLFDKTVSNIKEVKARGASVIGITKACENNKKYAGDYIIELPETYEIFMPSLGAVPLQLFAYYVAYQNGCDIDKPRNLAKSVTVE